MVERLKGYKGSIKWIHDREGHAGKVYWPGGLSGVTLDPGFDLGYNTSTDLYTYYTKPLNTHELQILEESIGIKGYQAKQIVLSGKYNGISISEDQALEIFPELLDSYWMALTHIWPEILDGTDGVHTAMLSLVYNRGVSNSKVIIELNDSIRNKNWKEVGEKIMNMQQNHSLNGIRIRRRMEGKLILDSLNKKSEDKIFAIPNLKKVAIAPIVQLRNIISALNLPYHK